MFFVNIWNGLAIHAKTGYLHDKNINTLTDQEITSRLNQTQIKNFKIILKI